MEYWNTGVMEWWNDGFRVQGWKPLNIEHRTSNSPEASKHLSAFGGSNVEWKKMKKQTYEMIL